MNKQRAKSQYHSLKHPTKQHCSQDTSCQQCCKCADILKKQNKILSEKNQVCIKEKEMFEKEILRLRKEIRQWQKKQKQLQNLPELKRRLREELKFQLDKQRKVEEMIMKQKLTSAREERDALKKLKEQLLEQLSSKEDQINRYQRELTDLKAKYSNLKEDDHKKSDLIHQHSQQIQTLTQRNSTLENALSDKTAVISKLEEKLNEAEKNYLIEKGKSADYQFELLKSKQQAKNAAISMQSLKKQAQESSNSIKELSNQNTKLDKLVQQLDSTIYSYSQLEGELRTRIIASEDYAIQKEIEVKQLECDFYDVLYRRSA